MLPVFRLTHAFMTSDIDVYIHVYTHLAYNPLYIKPSHMHTTTYSGYIVHVHYNTYFRTITNVDTCMSIYM